MAEAHPVSSSTAGSTTTSAVAVREGAGAAVAAGRKAPRQLKPRAIVGSALTHAVLIVATLFFVMPLVLVVSTSFKPNVDAYDQHIIPVHPTFQNYVHVLTTADRPFFSWLTNSLGVALATTVVGIIVAMPAAYALSRYEFLGKQGVLLSFLITQMFPGALLLIPLYRLFASLGFTDHPYSLVIAYATTALPFSVYMLKNFFDAVPRELDQAGLLDGLTPFGVFWRIVAPLTIPGIAVVGFFNFMAAWNEFMFANAFLNSRDALTLPVGLQSYVSFNVIEWGPLTAGSVLVTIPVLIMFIWAQRGLITGLTAGSVKG